MPHKQSDKTNAGHFELKTYSMPRGHQPMKTIRVFQFDYGLAPLFNGATHN